jgi:hypothetical protein
MVFGPGEIGQRWGGPDDGMTVFRHDRKNGPSPSARLGSWVHVLFHYREEREFLRD